MSSRLDFFASVTLVAHQCVSNLRNSFSCSGLHPNFPPVISRVRRLFRPSWGVLFVVLVSCSSSLSGRPSLSEGG